MKAPAGIAVFCIIVAAFSPQPASGQSDAEGTVKTAAEQLQKKIKNAVENIRDAKLNKDIAGVRMAVSEEFGLLGQGGQLLALALMHRFEADFVQKIEEVRIDKQVGGGDTNAGGTSLVSKGSVPAIIGLAVENGALTQEDSGTTVTLRSNPVGLFKALTGRGFISGYRDTDPALKFLRKISFAASFDTQRGQMPGTFTGDRQQLSSYSFRYDIYNKRDPRSGDFGSKEWTELITKRGEELGRTMNGLFQSLDRFPEFQTWVEAAQLAIASAPLDQIERTIKQQLVRLQEIRLPPEIESELLKYQRAVNAYLDSRNVLLEEAAKKPIITFEYTNVREPDLPDLSNFKVIAEGDLGTKGKADFTFNGSISIFNNKPAGMMLHTVRDFQFSGQLDFPIGPVHEIGAFVLSFSGKFERMREDAMMPSGTIVPDTKGDIGLAQIKFTIPVKGSGVKIPLSMTFATRTELIKEKEVRGNVGITFDLDSIFARLKP